MTKTTQLLSALALVAVASTLSGAQGSSDAGSGLGAGGGATGSVTPFGAGPGGMDVRRADVPIPPTQMAVFGGAQGQLAALTPNARVVVPGGGSAVVPAGFGATVGAVLSGSPTPAQVTAFTSGLPGVPATSAGALATSLQAFGASPNYTTLRAAIIAYNAAVDAVPAGTPIPAGLAVVRAALASAAYGQGNTFIRR